MTHTPYRAGIDVYFMPVYNDFVERKKTPRKMMRTRLKLRPGMRGTKKLVTTYGDRPVCARYWYDSERGKQYKTVELIVVELHVGLIFAALQIW